MKRVRNLKETSYSNGIHGQMLTFHLVDLLVLTSIHAALDADVAWTEWLKPQLVLLLGDDDTGTRRGGLFACCSSGRLLRRLIALAETAFASLSHVEAAADSHWVLLRCEVTLHVTRVIIARRRVVQLRRALV